jgi:hypothetical protein
MGVNVSENTEIIEDKSNDKVDKDSHIAIVMRSIANEENF